MNQTIDAARLTLIRNDLRLPAIKHHWPMIAEQSDKEGWPAARFLATLAEHEIAERDRRRIERHLAEARRLPGKTLDSFDFDAQITRRLGRWSPRPMSWQSVLVTAGSKAGPISS